MEGGGRRQEGGRQKTKYCQLPAVNKDQTQSPRGTRTLIHLMESRKYNRDADSLWNPSPITQSHIFFPCIYVNLCNRNFIKMNTALDLL